MLVHFWGTTCPACLAELPDIERLADRLQKRGVEVLCVCADEHDLSRVQEIARQHVQRLPVWVDRSGMAAVRFDAAVLPATFLIDGEGRLRARVVGSRQWTEATIEELLKNESKEPRP